MESAASTCLVFDNVDYIEMKSAIFRVVVPALRQMYTCVMIVCI